MTTRTAAALLIAATAAAVVAPAPAMALPLPIDPAIVYQGRLDDGGQPADGAYDFYLELYNEADGGNFVDFAYTPDSPLTVDVQDGLFTANLNFHAAGVHNGVERWLQIAVRPHGDGPYMVLSPRQRLAPAPFANLALNTRGLHVDEDDNFGIGVDQPQDRLHLGSGALRFPDGTRQTTAYAPLHGNLEYDSVSLVPGQSILFGVYVAGAEIGDAAVISPPGRLPWDVVT